MKFLVAVAIVLSWFSNTIQAEDSAPKKPARRRRSRAKKVESPAATEEAAPEEPAAAAVEAPSIEEQAEPASAEEAVAAPPEAEPVEAPAPTPARAPARRRAAAPSAAGTDASKLLALVEQLASEIAGQRSALVQLGAGVDELSARLDRAARKPRLGVFVDVPNVLYGLEAGEPPLDMGKLLAMLSEGRELVRATAYAPVSDDPREASNSPCSTTVRTGNDLSRLLAFREAGGRPEALSKSVRALRHAGPGEPLGGQRLRSWVTSNFAGPLRPDK